MANLIEIIFCVCITIFLFWKYIFLRDPKRDIPSGNNIVSPGDGKIIKIIKTNKNNIKIKKKLGSIQTACNEVSDECYIVSIFMSVLNVHINRSPISGKILSIKHKKGGFSPASKFNSFITNEKNEVLIENETIGKVKVIQVAGAVARRIVCFLDSGNEINKGQKIGLIKLGSQVNLILPTTVKLRVKEKQKVKGGETIIAEYD